jgi:nanoRNase/pAp phosphatase (c-di-AMP/oligoRNAs hydrolase)
MNNKSTDSFQNHETTTPLDGLDRVLQGEYKLLIVVHDNPDPDAIAAAAALRYLAEKRYGSRASIAFGGIIGRAENRAMVTKLNISMKQINRVRLERYERIAMLDTQPGAGNNSLPSDTVCHIVIDHHPCRPNLRAELVLINPQVGATATLLVEWLDESGLAIPTNLATALAYAISSETQDLGRESSKRDIQAYFKVFTKSSMRKLAQIIHPSLPRSYFIAVAKTLHRAKTFRNLICAHLGEIPTPDIVAEMADFLLRHERMRWSLCTGQFGDELIISLRSSYPKARAGKLVRRLIANRIKSARNKVGGHDMTAGGRIPLTTGTGEEATDLENTLSQDLARVMGYKEPDWKPLLNLEQLLNLVMNAEKI